MSERERYHPAPAGLPGKIFIPQSRGEKKHPCADCFECQWCADARCASCCERCRKEKELSGKEGT